MDIKQLRAIAHHLRPVVTIGDAGIAANAARELDRALARPCGRVGSFAGAKLLRRKRLADHELVKVRLNIVDRTARTAAIGELCSGTGATLVQRIGKIAVLYRHNPEAKPALSNVARYS